MRTTIQVYCETSHMFCRFGPCALFALHFISGALFIYIDVRQGKSFNPESRQILGPGVQDADVESCSGCPCLSRSCGASLHVLRKT